MALLCGVFDGEIRGCGARLSDEAVFQNRISTSIIVQMYLEDLHHIAARDMSYWILQISHHQDSGILQPHRYGPTSLNLISTLRPQPSIL
jgi:hypothetical protein